MDKNVFYMHACATIWHFQKTKQITKTLFSLINCNVIKFLYKSHILHSRKYIHWNKQTNQLNVQKTISLSFEREKMYKYLEFHYQLTSLHSGPRLFSIHCWSLQACVNWYDGTALALSNRTTEIQWYIRCHCYYENHFHLKIIHWPGNELQ